MPTIREMFPFGDLDDAVVERASNLFPILPAAEVAAGFDLAKAIVDAMEHMTSVLERVDLTPARWRLMVALVVQAGPDGATVGELADHLGVREPTITATVDRLQREGLVERRRSDADRRVVHVTLTAAGAATVAEVVPHVADRLVRFVGSLGGPSETRVLASRVRTAIAAST